MIGNDTNLFGRIVTALVTPFDEKLNIDFKAVEKITEHLINTGSNAIIVSGTTGESPNLEESEQKELLTCVRSIAKGKVKVLMGTGSNNTRKSIKASISAEEQGADGLLTVVPYYNKPSQAGLLAHFKEIAKSVSLPIMLYNIPGRTGINMAVETTLELAHSCKNILALKDSTSDLVQAAEIASAAPQNFRLYAGDDVLTLAYLSIGACGIVSVASQIVGSKIKEMIDAFFAGNTEKAREIHYQYLPLFKGLFLAPNPTCVKYALSRQKLCNARLRLPLVELDDKQRAQLDKILDSVPIDTIKQLSQLTN